MRNVNMDLIYKEVFQGKDDNTLTSLVLDKESYDSLWEEITDLSLKNVLTGEEPDQELLQKLRAGGRIPIIKRTQNTAHIFDQMGIITDRFCGIIRGGSKHPLVLD